MSFAVVKPENVSWAQKAQKAEAFHQEVGQEERDSEKPRIDSVRKWNRSHKNGKAESECSTIAAPANTCLSNFRSRFSRTPLEVRTGSAPRTLDGNPPNERRNVPVRSVDAHRNQPRNVPNVHKMLRSFSTFPGDLISF